MASCQIVCGGTENLGSIQFVLICESNGPELKGNIYKLHTRRYIRILVYQYTRHYIDPCCKMKHSAINVSLTSLEDWVSCFSME